MRPLCVLTKTILILTVLSSSFIENSVKFMEPNAGESLMDQSYQNIDEALKILNTTLTNDANYKGQAWEKTARVVDMYGPRMWGSQQLEDAVDYMIEIAKEDGFEVENIKKEKLTDVKKWTRGKEKLTLLSPRKYETNIPMIGLGLSVGADLTAELVYLETFDDLKKADVNGKIAFFNEKWEGYGSTVKYRTNGVNLASQKGAIGVIIRSVTSVSLETPHTGALFYADGVKKIPACAISMEDADMFKRMNKRGSVITVKLYMEAKFEDKTVTANNLIIDYPGTENKDEIILLGGHIDSWDVGPQTGATDDLSGFYVCYEAVRTLKKLGLKTKRTLRIIGWSGEEMGQDNNGAHVYANNRIDELKKNSHVMAFESDGGVNRLSGFGISGSNKARAIIGELLKHFEPYGMSTLGANGGGADIDDLGDDYNVPTMSNIVKETPDSQEYFMTHHTAADTMTALNKDGMDRNVVGIAGLVYAIANSRNILPRNNE